MKSAVLLVLALALVPKAGADESFNNLTLEDLLNMKTSVATKTEMTPRTAPASVTVVTSDQISNSGARNFNDVLRLVPGIGFGTDGFNTTSIGMRGMWANEGKVLVLIDGMEMNEILFSTIQFDNRFPVDQVDRIEIIRGPGSAVYGGFAELAVINVITKSGAKLSGCEVEGKYGQMSHTWARRTMEAACGKKVNGMDVSVAAYNGQAQATDRTFTGYDGAGATQTYSADDQRQDPTWLNIGVSSDNFRFRYIREYYEGTTKSGYGYNSTEPIRAFYSSFIGNYLGLEYDIHATEKLKITPSFKYKQQKPWYTVDYEFFKSANGLSNFTADRMNAGVQAAYEASSNLNFLVGYEREQDWGLNENFEGTNQPEFHNGGGSRREYFTNSAWLQSVYNFGFATATVGARYDKHEKVQGAWSPRLAITKAEPNWHAKILAAGAFRAPTIMDIDTDPVEPKPDRADTYEVEGGVKTSSNTYLTANVFKTEIRDPIMYNYDSVANQTIKTNFNRTGTYGVEVEHRLKDTFGYSTFTYSYYKADGLNTDRLQVPGHPEMLLGFPSHKFTWIGSFKTGLAHLTVNPSAIYMTPYYGFNWDSATNSQYTQKLSPGVIVNAFLLYRDLWWKGFDLGAGVYNITDVDYRIVQPYTQSNHAPMPTESREVMVRADYKLEF